MIRSLLRSLIDNLTVTHTEVEHRLQPVASEEELEPVTSEDNHRLKPVLHSSLRIDAYVLRAAELLPLEEVEVINLATGERFRTFVEAAAEGSGEVHLASGERSSVRKGDRIAVIAFALLHEGQTLAHKAKCVTVDGANHVTAISER